GVLVKCDASIKAIIVKIDSDRNDIIVEDLDDEHLVIKETKLVELKRRLEETLKSTLREPETSDSE
ncbi:RNA polymerase II transcription factor B subunit 5, partial [Lepidopterella palustris CBS 459.81]